MKPIQALLLLPGFTCLAGEKPPVPVVKLDVSAHAASKTALRSRILEGQIPGVQSDVVSLPSGASSQETSSRNEDRVHLVLAGSGAFVTGGKAYPVTPETIAHFPLGAAVELRATGSEGLDVLVLRQTLTPMDLEDLKGYPDISRAAYVKAYKDCEAYGESIKSAQTTSRTLLPKLIVPRMAVGTVETSGPDRVAPHRHPMLEQYFLGLAGNEITVLTDDSRTPLGAHQLLHIPLGSNHGAVVTEGKKLYYVWMDFFQDRQGLEWLNEHKPLVK